MQLTTMSLLVTSANAATVLMTNSAMLGGAKEGWNTTVWSVDTTTGSSQMVADTFLSRSAQAGVVCNNVYYSVWAEISTGFGLRALDLASGESSDLATSSLFHVIACDPKDNSKLLGTASDFTSMLGVGAGDAPFHLKSYDPATQTEAVVGTFPANEVRWGGYDGIFSFTQDGAEVWAAWPKDECPNCADAKKGGHVHVMDTSSGEIKSSANIAFGGKKGTPYFLLPDAKRGVFIMKGGGDVELKWADLEVGDNSIKAKIGSTDASALWASSSPVQMCGSQLLAFSKGSVHIGASVLYEISPADGAVINTVDLLSELDIEGQPQTNIGALACLKPSSEDFALV